jgi:hypothetical protein
MSEELQVVNSGSMSLKQIGDRVNLVHQVLEKVLKKGTHYGTLPGCGNKMVLLKPGADVLAMTFRLAPQFKIERSDMENGHREYDVTCSMYGSDGSLLGQGVGSASTMEKKYRYRKNESGAKIENEDIADCYNTVLKMAKKRAHVDATLTVTGAGDLFTQDLIEDEDEQPKPPVTMPTPKAAPGAFVPEGMPEHDTRLPLSTPADGNMGDVTGMLQEVNVKEGTAKNGKPWTRYGLIVDGETYGTFDKNLYNGALELVNQKVWLEVETKGKFKTVMNLGLQR